jgi:anti-sigma regulatory factor (Ser/Thr protein kinase)
MKNNKKENEKETGKDKIKGENNLILKIKNDIGEIAVLRDKIGDFCRAKGVSERFVNNVKLAMDEILTNVISYAFKDRDTHEIIIRAGFENIFLHIEIEDDGWQFNPLGLPEPDIQKPLEDRQIGGLGVYLVRKLMDGVEYRRENEKNILVMKKSIAVCN